MVEDERVQLACFSVLLYAREGWAAAPPALLRLLRRRQTRALSRSTALRGMRFCLHGIKSLVGAAVYRVPAPMLHACGVIASSVLLFTQLPAAHRVVA